LYVSCENKLDSEVAIMLQSHHKRQQLSVTDIRQINKNIKNKPIKQIHTWSAED